VMLRDRRASLVKAAVCARDSALLPSNDFSYGVWIRISDISSTVSSILYKGETPESRMPALFLNGGNSQLMVRQMDDKKQVVFNIADSLPLKQWIHVVLTVAPGAIRVFMDGKQIASTHHVSTPLVDHHPLFCSANSTTYPPAKAEIGRLYYAPFAMTDNQVNSLMKLSRPSYAEVSQNWTASYEFKGTSSSMKLAAFAVGGGFVSGQGSDALGAFTLKGSIASNNQVTMDKVYPTWTVKYSGTLSMDGKKLDGKWTAGTNSGTFTFQRS